MTYYKSMDWCCRQRKLEEVSKHELLPEHPNCVKFYRAWDETRYIA